MPAQNANNIQKGKLLFEAKKEKREYKQHQVLYTAALPDKIRWRPK
jgi:hypothetical protein